MTLGTISAEHYLVLAGILFSIGLFGILLRRNILIILLCLELMLNAANLVLITASSVHNQADGQILAFFVMVIAAVMITGAIVAKPLAISLKRYRSR